MTCDSVDIRHFKPTESLISLVSTSWDSSISKCQEL